MDKIAMQCIECGYINVYRLRHSDGRKCLHCEGRVVPIAKAIIEDEGIVSVQMKVSEVKKFRKALESFIDFEEAIKRVNRIPR